MRHLLTTKLWLTMQRLLTHLRLRRQRCQKTLRPHLMRAILQRIRPQLKNQRRHKPWPHRQKARKATEETVNREEKEEYTIAGKFAGSARMQTL
jgi:hypothetical protein